LSLDPLSIPQWHDCHRIAGHVGFRTLGFEAERSAVPIVHLFLPIVRVLTIGTLVLLAALASRWVYVQLQTSDTGNKRMEMDGGPAILLKECEDMQAKFRTAETKNAEVRLAGCLDS